MNITFLPLSYKVEGEPGQNLFCLAREYGIDVGGICAGAKTCGKCKVLITKGNDRNFNEEEMLHLSEEERSKGYRLACCFEVKEDTCIILPGKNNGCSVNSDKSVTEFDGKEIQKFNKIDTTDTKSRFGIAIDLGTTTVVARLWNLTKKRGLQTFTQLNPQRLYGQDVISRITYASQGKEQLEKLTNQIRHCCNDLIQEAANSYGIEKERIDRLVIAANTTMTHIVLGRRVDGLLKIPFQGVSYGGVKVSPGEIGLDINKEGFVYVMPGIGGHVGGDTVSCILSKRLYQQKGISLLIDIGTNGELILARDGKMTACSAAAGPAFEGGTLDYGMRAETGAITGVLIRKDEVKLEYIGKEDGVMPVGICGSGVIEAIAELYRTGIIDETGRLQGNAGETNEYVIWRNQQSKVAITQKDIREIQLAKGAIYAGMMLLLKEENIKIEHIDNLYVAGAFGSNLDIMKAITIGLFPPLEERKVILLGNAALEGAERVLLDDREREIAEKTAPLVKHLELAIMEEFQEEFIKAISFPQKKN